MNRNPDGTLLTDEQLIAIALEFNCADEDKIRQKVRNSHGARSFLKEITLDARWRMWHAGRLEFRTELFTPTTETFSVDMDAWTPMRRKNA